MVRFVFILMFFCFNIAADVAAYGNNVAIFARDRSLLFLHEHRFDFSEENNNVHFISYVELVDVEAGKTIFKKDSPYYTKIFFLGRGEYLLALSNIKAGNNPQIVVYSRSGDILMTQSVQCSDIPAEKNCLESIYNYVEWFDDRWPHITSKVSSGFLIVTVDENEFRIPLSESPLK